MYIYGRNVIKELNSGMKIKKIYLQNNFNEYDIIEKLNKLNVEIVHKERKYLDKLVNGVHQGIVVEVSDFDNYKDLDDVLKIDKKYPLVVMLDHLEDPHNFGAIIRSCEALGVDAIIIPNNRSVSLNNTVIKTSAGAYQYIDIIRVSNLVNAINFLKKNGYFIVGTSLEGTSFNEIDYNMPICLVIGNEGKGISRLVLENCDYVAKIDMFGKTNSLNASVATAIMLYKIIDKRMKL